ncbi:MAG: hypothetical protein R3Y62_01730 [Eubacteriales bacterium]
MAEFKDILPQRKASGLSVRGFYFEHGISQHTYYYRLRKLRQQMKGSAIMTQKQNNAAEIQQKVDELADEITRLKSKLDRMNELLLLAQKARFAPSSEKTEYVMSGQSKFFDEAENEQNSKANNLRI